VSLAEIFGVLFVIVFGGMWLASWTERKLRERDFRKLQKKVW
jgi:cytochrome bd-type quinol oxidase subunit 2